MVRRRGMDDGSRIPGAISDPGIELAPACEGVAVLAATDAAVAAVGGGCELLGVELEKWDSMHSVT